MRIFLIIFSELYSRCPLSLLSTSLLDMRLIDTKIRKKKHKEFTLSE